VWTIRDEDGYPAPLTASGDRAQPFWSLRSRVERTQGQIADYAPFSPEEIPLESFRATWLPNLDRDGIRVGLNWSGTHATGYDLTGAEVERNLAAIIQMGSR
jgi:hypothetical protein